MLDKTFKPDADELESLRPVLARLVEHLETGRCRAVGIFDREPRSLPAYIWVAGKFELPAATLRHAGRTYNRITIQFVTDADPILEFGFPMNSAKHGFSLEEAFRSCGSDEELASLDEYKDYPGPPLTLNGDGGFYETAHFEWCARARPIEERFLKRLISGEWYIEGVERGAGVRGRTTLPKSLVESANIMMWMNMVYVNGTWLDHVRVYPSKPDLALAPQVAFSEESETSRTPFRLAGAVIDRPSTHALVLVHFEGDAATIIAAGTALTFRGKQGRVIEVLNRAQEAGDPWVRPSTIRKAGVASYLPDLFKKHAWREFIEQRDGDYRLRTEVLSPHPDRHQ